MKSVLAFFDLHENSQRLFLSRQIFLLATVVLAVVLTILHYRGVLLLPIEYFVFYSLIIFLFALWRPNLAFLLLVSLLPLEIVTLMPPEWGMNLRPYQWVGLLLGLALIGRLLTGRLRFPLFVWTAYDTAIGVLLGGVLIAGAAAGGLAVKQSVVVLSFGYLYGLGRIFFQNTAAIRQAFFFFAVSASLSIGWGIAQNILFLSDMESWSVMPGRPNGTLAEPDWLGFLIIMLLPAALSWLVSSVYQTKVFRVIAPTGWLTLLFLVLILTVSRSAWLGGLVAGAATFLLFLVRRGKPLAYRSMLVVAELATLAFGLALFLAETVPLTRFALFDRAGSTASQLQTITIACAEKKMLPDTIQDVRELAAYDCEHILLEERAAREAAGEMITTIKRPDPNIDIRQQIYATSLQVIGEHPVLGVGWGMIGPRLGTDERGASYNASNIFLEIWLGGGLLGLAGFLMWIVWALLSGVRSWWQERDRELSAVLLATLGGLLVFNLFNTGLLLGFVWFFLAAWAVVLSPRLPHTVGTNDTV